MVSRFKFLINMSKCLLIFFNYKINNRYLCSLVEKLKDNVSQFSSQSSTSNISSLDDDAKLYSEIDKLSKNLFEKMTKNEDKNRLITDTIKFYSNVHESCKPSCLTISDVDYLSKVTLRGKLNYLKYRKMKEVKAELKKLQKPENFSTKMDQNEIKKGQLFDEKNKLIYGFNNNSLICAHKCINRMKNYLNQKLVTGFIFGQKIVIDFSYDQFMTIKQHLILNNQVKGVIGLLRNQNNPFSLHFCNFNVQNPSAQYLIKELGSIEKYAINFTSKSYLDIFPKEKLVYLTPHTKERLEYNSDDIYIIGAMIDVGSNIPYSSQKAAQDEIKTASLPIDETLLWKKGNKCLTINQVFGILADLRDNNGTVIDIFRRHIPSRKVYNSDDQDKILSRKRIKYEERRNAIKNKFNLNEEEMQSLPII